MKTTGLYPKAQVDTAQVPAVGQAGGVLLTDTVRAAGLAGSGAVGGAGTVAEAVRDP